MMIGAGAMAQRHDEQEAKESQNVAGGLESQKSEFPTKPGCPDVLAAPVYDMKLVHLLLTAAESVEWTVKEKWVWNQQEKKMNRQFLRLNLIGEYNQHMNSADIADLLRGAYRPDHWM
jgi:hypothetical protein